MTVLFGFNSSKAQWYSVNSNTTENIKDLFMMDSFNGYCVGGGDEYGFPQGFGIVMKTTDGGDNWETIYSKDSLSINKVYVLTDGPYEKLIAFATKNGSSYMLSTIINTPSLNWMLDSIPYAPYEVKLYNNVIFYLDNINGGLSKYQNGVITTNLLNTNDVSLYDISQSGLMYVSANVDSIYISIDTNNTNFTSLSQHPTNVLSSNQTLHASIMHNSDTIVFKGTYPSSIVYSTNLGLNWSHNLGGGEGKSLILESGKTISLDQNSNKIRTTYDLGQNWNVVSINGAIFTGLACSKNNSSVFAFGKEGIIYKNNITIGISDTGNLKNKINIYPNPAKDVLQIEICENVDIDRIELFDINGKKIRIFRQDEIILNLSGLIAGEYILKILTKEGEFTQKVILE